MISICKKIAASGQAFRIAQTPQGWRFLAGDKLLYLQPGSGDTYTASCTPEEWQGFWHRYFDLNRNYAAIRAAVPKQDVYLCAAARAGAGIRILRQDAWEMLVTFIISQRKNIPAIQACVETLCTRYGAPLLQPGGNVLYAFPNGAGARRGRGAGIAGLRAGLPRPVCSGCRPGSCSGSAGPCRAGNPCPMPGCWKL